MRNGRELTESSVREYLAERIAQFKVPGRVFIVDALPTGATGKVNRMKLSEHFTGRLSGDGGEPKNELQEKICGIYREVLGSTTIGRTDNFFEMGGDSLRATQVINRVRALFEVNLSIATIFGKPTVSELAEEIAQRQRTDEVARFRG
jgi:acyl carrier protein